ncbi:MAG TPA: ATP-binding protein, partial [Pirellulaceae bacterium]|nr:ATP-binding protein [Pirellulaceae bacterium]
VVLNLIRNAIEAMSAPNVQERVLTITTRQCETRVQASIRDTGGGIAPELRPLLFEPFQTTKAEGLGIGLSVSRTLIEAHRGKLWAISDATTPTTFVVELPLSEADA